MGKGEIALALTPACIALDVTSQRYARAKRSSQSNFKKFVRDHLWLITYMGFPGLMASTVRVPFSHPNLKPDSAGTVGIEDIIYHVIRCSLVHSDDKATRIVWNSAVALGLDLAGQLILSDKLVWGLLGAVIFSPFNKDEKIAATYWISIADYKMFVSEFWGRIDLAKRVVKTYTNVDIP